MREGAPWAKGEDFKLQCSSELECHQESLLEGHVVVGVNNQGLWQRFCEAIDLPEREHNPRFENGMDRVMNREEPKAAIEARLSQNTTEHWLEEMLARGIACGPINTIDRAVADPQVRAHGIVVRMGDREFIGSPLKMSRTPTGPRLGC